MAATLDHAEDVLALAQACAEHLQDRGIDQWDAMYPDRTTIDSDIRSRATFVALSDFRVVAAIVVDESQDPGYAYVAWQFTTGSIAVVHRLMVHPELEGVGMGRKLMEFAEKHARSLGYTAIRLDAFTKNQRALCLYDRLGYRPAGIIKLRKGHFRCFEKEL